MNAKIKTELKTYLAVEICYCDLHLARAQEVEPGRFVVECRSIKWREYAPSLLTQQGKDELIAAFKTVLAEWGISGGTIALALNGDFCVTRVVVGSNEFVETETTNVESRSKLYLALGHGRKVTARSIRKIDGRHQHALLSVVNARTLDIILDIATAVGMQLELVEPSLVSLARLQQLKTDANGPALLFNAGRGNEVGIVENGYLYLDYRPPQHDDETEIAKIVGRHLHRLQRYYDRYIRLGKGKISSGYLCGFPERAAALQTAFRQEAELELEMLHTIAAEIPAEMKSQPESQQCAALGLLARKLLSPSENEEENLNLIRHLQLAKRQAVWPRMLAACWPIAGVLLLSLGLEGINAYQRYRANQYEVLSVQAEATKKQLDLIDSDLIRQKNKLKYLENIQKQVSRTSWSEFATHIGQCLPNDAWLDALSVDKAGKVSISGGSFSQDGVFEFVKWLNELPDVTQVSLTGTESKRVTAGPATGFEVSCEVTH